MFIDQWKDKLHQRQSLFIGEESAYRSAIVIPLVKVKDEWHILFEVRSFSMRKQPGDICFPGGRIDETDASPMAAAIRETVEELGVDSEAVQIVGELSPFILSASFVIYPFVVTIEGDEFLHAYNKDEVEEVFTIPVKWLMNYEPYMHHIHFTPTPSPDFPYHKIMNGMEYEWRTRAIEEWFFDYEHYTIWGITARILKYFIDSIK